MSYGNFRSSTGDLHHYDDPHRRPERWDRDKFERYARDSRRGPEERESFRFEEHDRFGSGRSQRDFEFEDRYERRESRGARAPVIERDHRYEEERYGRRPGRPEWLDEPSAAEVASRALAPYRRKSIVERDIVLPSRPARPGMIRRQSSLDTFDRKPVRRYDEYERDEYRLPSNVPIPLPILDRRRSPSRHRAHREHDFEEIRFRELDREPEFREEDYRDVHIHREKSRHRRSMSRHKARSTRSSTSSFEEVSPVREVGKKGRTRMPKRLVHKQAVIDLGYPFEEEEDFIVVKRALEKDQIDEVIKISEGYKEDTKITYKYEETKEIEAAVPPAPPTIVEALPPPPPAVIYAAPPPPPPSMPAMSVRSHSPTRTVYEERIDESNSVHGPLTMLVPPERHSDRELVVVPSDRRSEREIKAEIRALEAERRLIKMERESEYDFVERVERRDPKREIIRVEKDRKGRRKPDAKVLAAMVGTLT